MSEPQPLSIDLYWSFRSPYSYLVTPKIVELGKAYHVDVNVRVVYPLAVRTPDFFETNDPLWISYMLRDIVRIAEIEQIPLGMPQPDPVVQDIVTREIAADQPHIFRLVRLGALAAEQGIGLDFIYEVSTLIWSGKVNWTEGSYLEDAVARAGGDLAAMDQEIITRESELEAAIDANHADQRAAGHWGVPLMVFNGEPFFGQDRIEALIWRMKQHGLTTRS